MCIYFHDHTERAELVAVVSTTNTGSTRIGIKESEVFSIHKIALVWFGSKAVPGTSFNYTIKTF